MSGPDFLASLTGLVVSACQPLFTEWGATELTGKVELERPATREHGDLALNIALVAAKPVGRPPRELAGEVAAALEADAGLKPYIASVAVAGPGFINIYLAGGELAGSARQALSLGADFGRSPVAVPGRLLLEFVSANPTGPLHVGHGRYAAYGDSLRRILAFAGHEVTTEFYINDYGTQMDLFGRSLASRYGDLAGVDVPMPEGGYVGDYTRKVAAMIYESAGEGLAAQLTPEPSPEALAFFRDEGCALVLAEVRSLLERFRVTFDNWFSETGLYTDKKTDATLELLRGSGAAVDRDGALWLLTSRYGDDKDRVLVRGTGEPTYFASDISYHRDKLDRGFDHLVNIWGADHHGYVPRVKAAFEALSHDPEKLEIIIGQLVNVIELGERKQMSKRAGTMVTLEELIDSIGVDAARFFLVDRSQETTLDLDLEKARLKSEENPVYYVQYAHARISSILKRAREEQLPAGDAAAYVDLAGEEKELVLKLMDFPRLVETAASSRSPHKVTGYARELAAVFHVFYHNCPVLKADAAAAAFRLELCMLTRNVIATALDLVGVTAPESM
ncbi:MAG: arginine--tRNA ligase [Thermoleophilia bacterium]